MTGRHSITERVCETLKEQVLSGAFPPGARLDVNALAAAEGVSPTPVRGALNRLVGDGLIRSHANEGFHMPLTSEAAFRDLYECCEALLGLAIARGEAAGRTAAAAAIRSEDPHDDIALRTEAVFLSIMALAGNPELSRAFDAVNRRLRPARFIEGEWLQARERELSRIARALAASDVDRLGKLLTAYHRLRVRHVAQLVTRLHRPADDVLSRG